MYSFEKRISQSDHDRMVGNTAVHLKNNTYDNIKADVAGYLSPKIIKNHIPDLTASKGSNEYILEVETFDTISIDHTKKQWKEFGDYAASSIFKYFIVVIPKGYTNEAQRVLNELGVSATIWTAN